MEVSVGRARRPFTGYYKWQQKENRIDMWKLIVPVFLIALFIFVGIMLHDARTIIVTTAYHVFRALLLARREGLKCVGFGAKTRWYFTLNALLREFIGYLWMTWKRHALVVGVAAGIIMIGNMIS